MFQWLKAFTLNMGKWDTSLNPPCAIYSSMDFKSLVSQKRYGVLNHRQCVKNNNKENINQQDSRSALLTLCEGNHRSSSHFLPKFVTATIWFIQNKIVSLQTLKELNNFIFPSNKLILKLLKLQSKNIFFCALFHFVAYTWIFMTVTINSTSRCRRTIPEDESNWT